MALTVTARAGEPLDALVWRTAGAGIDAVPAVLAANPGTAALADALPEGRTILIPEIAAAPAEADLVQLWDD